MNESIGRPAKFLLLLGSFITFVALGGFQWFQLAMDSEQEQHVADIIHQDEQRNEIEFTAVYGALKSLHVDPDAFLTNYVAMPVSPSAAMAHAPNAPEVASTNSVIVVPPAVPAAASITEPKPSDAPASNATNKPPHVTPEGLNDFAKKDTALAAEDHFLKAHEDWIRYTFFALCVGAILSLIGAFMEVLGLLREKGLTAASILTELLSSVVNVLGLFYIPVVFGALLILHITGNSKIDWIAILLALIALSPQLLPILSQYVEKISISLKGIDISARSATVRVGGDTVGGGGAGGLPAQQGDKGGAAAIARRATLGLAAPASIINPQGQKILKTLWNFQNEHFPSSPGSRWSFGIGTAAAGYMAFSLGLLDLIKNDLVGIDSRGFAFLNDRGMQYCAEFSEQVMAYPEMYSNFVAAT